MFTEYDRSLLQGIFDLMTTNSQALSDLTASVQALQAAANGSTENVADAIEAQRAAVDAVTTQLGGTPPVDPTAVQTTDAPTTDPATPAA
jgi:hypothetical protein